MTLKPLLPVCLPVSFYCSDLLKIFIFPAAAAAWMNFDCSCGLCHGTIASCEAQFEDLAGEGCRRQAGPGYPEQ